jgi:NTP pyrophosphatase (non-canonical NTP hydrolase)
MEFNEYQKQARATAIYKMPIVYPTLGLAGETGEVAEKVKKTLRDEAGEFSEEKKTALALELGDVLWYVANLAADLGVDLETVAKGNIQKLEDRKNRNKIQGSGDNR